LERGVNPTAINNEALRFVRGAIVQLLLERVNVSLSVRNAVFLRTEIVLTTAKTNQNFKVTTVLHTAP
jgi:hypothetical protein